MKHGLLSTTLAIAALLAATGPAAAAGGQPFNVELNGANEVATGDPDGLGTADLTLNRGLGRVCFDIIVQDVGGILAGHIHQAPAGVNGPVVVNFQIPTNGLSGCVGGLDRDLVMDIGRNPDQYYVNLHNAEFPGGAIRGQLG